MIDAFAFLGLTRHMSPRSAIPARWRSIYDLSRKTTQARLAKKDTDFYRSALFRAPYVDGTFLHLTELRPADETVTVSCHVVGLTGGSLTVVSDFRKRNILGAFAEMTRRPVAKDGRRSKGSLFLFDQTDIGQMLPYVTAPAFGISTSTTLPKSR